jgi:hypothetical protein
MTPSPDKCMMYTDLYVIREYYLGKCLANKLGLVIFCCQIKHDWSCRTSRAADDVVWRL